MKNLRIYLTPLTPFFLFGLLTLFSIEDAKGQSALFSSSLPGDKNCGGAQVDFTMNDETGVLDYEWDFGNGQALVGGPYTGPGSTNASTTYIASGQYTAQLTVNKGLPSQDIQTLTINIYDAPSPAFEATNNTGQGCLNPNFTVEFDYTASTTNIVQWVYNFGDGSGDQTFTAAGGSDGDVTHDYTETGTYNVFLTVTDINGCSQFLFQPGIVTINSTPVADFSVGSVSSGDLPITVNFNDASTDAENAIAFYEWSVEKQSAPGVSIATSSDQNAAIEFTAYDDYNVILTVSTSPGECSKTITKAFSLNENTVDFTPAASQETCIGSNITFTNASVDGNSGAMSYLWDFGDGNTSTDQNPTHSYSTATGSPFEVSLTVDFSDGNQKTLVRSNYVTVHPSLNAAISADVQDSCEAFDVNFTATTGAVLYEWDFAYNGSTPNFTTSSASNTASHNYTVDGSYDVLLQITTASGCVQQILETSFIELSAPSPSFIIGAGEEEGCVGEIVNFDANGSTNLLPSGNNGIASYHWDFDNDGNDDATGVTASHNYPTEGTYAVKLRIVTQAGCEAEVVYPNFIKRGLVPTAGFNISQADFCIGTEVDFTSTSSPNVSSGLLIDRIEWDFGDGNTEDGDPSMNAGLNTPAHTYEDDSEDNATPFTVALKVSSNGCESTTSQQLNINYPVARFTITGNDFNCLNSSQTTTFDATASEGVQEYRWEFGDGSIEPASGYTTGSNPSTTHEYATSGDFTATLYVKNNTNSCEHTTTSEVNVSIGTVGFSADVLELCYTSETVTFTNNSTTNTTGTTTYEWDFGTGASPATFTGTTPPAVSYTSSGLKTIVLTQTESHGCVRTKTETNYIEAKGPTADFSFTSTNSNDAIQCLEPSQSMTFTNTSTVFGTGISAVAWSWDFGSGASPATSNLQDPSGTPVTYSTSGQKTISLTVTDNEGCAHTVIKNTSVSVPNPIASFETDATSYCIITDASNKEVSITNNSSESILNSITTWSWDFGVDASPATSSDQNPGAVGYTSTGGKTITLTVTTTDGCTSSTTRNITVYEANASFTVADATLDCAPQMATFTDTSNDIVAWEWDFGDQFGSKSNQQHPTHMYVLPGAYDVTLTTTSAGGCQQASAVQQVTVDGPYYTTYDFTPDNGCIEDDPQVDFDITGLVKVDRLQLDWGDGATAFSDDNMIFDAVTTVNTSHIYNHNGDIGTFKPILTLTDDLTQVGACGSYIFPAPKDVIISSKPVPSFSSKAIVGNGCEDVEIQFTDETQLNGGLTDSRYPLKTWTWDFGDGSAVSNDKNPRHAFTTDGTFTVTLTVATEFGCEASKSEDIVVRPSILDGTVANSQTVCSGDTPVVFDAATPTGGTGSYTYLWETSTNGTDWVNATGTNNQEDYAPSASSPSAQTTVYYRRAITSGPCEHFTDAYTVITDITTVGGSLATDATECYGENNATLILSGETGDIQKWQFSSTSDFSADVNDVVNTTHTLSYENLTATRYYRAEVKNGVCSADFSGTGTITVLPEITGNVIGSDIVACIDQAAATLTATAPSGSAGNFTYQWQESNNNTNFTDIGGATGTTYDPGILTSDTWFRRRVISDGNCEATSGSLKVEVSPLAAAGNDQTTSDLSVTMAADISGFRTADGGTWSLKTKPSYASSPIIDSPNSATSTISGLVPGSYTFTWTVSNGTCSMTDDVDITVEPKIQVGVAPASVDEDGVQNLVYTFTASGQIDSPLTINFNVSGSATYTSDVANDDATSFSNTAGTVTLSANTTAVAVNVTPNDDNDIEGDETLILTVATGTGYEVDTPSAATGTITDDDDDNVVMVLTKDRDAEEENTVSVRYTITLHDTNASGAVLTNETGSDISCTITYTEGTASGTLDFGNLNAQSVNVLDGTSSRNRTKNVTDDDIIELTETISAQLSGASGPAGVTVSVDATSVSANVIDNDDDKATLVITKLNDGVEGGQDIEYQIKLTDGASTDLTNQTGSRFTGTLAFSNTADINDMTEGSFPGTFSIANNSGSTNYTFDPIYDTHVEIESLTATISSPVANNGITPAIGTAAATASIDDNAEIEISTTQNGVEETPATTNVQYTVKLTGPNPADAGATTVDYTNESGAAITANLGYSKTAVAADLTTSLPGTVSIANTSGNSLIDLVVNDDLLVEGDETLNAALSSPTTGVTVSGTKGNADATISDNDDAGVVKVDVERVQHGNEDGTVPVQFSVKLHDGTDPLTNATGSDITVDIAFLTGSTTAQEDFSTTFASLSPVAIADGETSTLITLNVVDDLLIEEDEVIRATISNPTGATIDAATADANVLDDDDDNVHIKITATQDGIEDGNGTTANNVQFDIELTDADDRNGNTLTNATGTSFTGTLGYSGADGTDFDNALATNFTIADGESTVALDYDAKEDVNVEIESLTATISGESHASVPVSIVVGSDVADIDDDAVLEIVKTTDGDEQGPVNIVYTVQLTDGSGTDYFNTSGSAITVDVDFAGNAETADISGGLGQKTVSIATGGSNDQTLTLTVIDDAVLEIDETITAALSNPSTGVTITSVPGLQVASAGLTDNDTAAVTITDESETEGTDLVFTLSLNNQVEGNVSVDVSFTNVTSENNDYAESTQSFTFTGGTPGNQSVTVSTADDALLEINETFTAAIALTAGNSEVSVSDTGTGTIVDGDDAEVTISNASATEGNNIEFDLTLDKDVDGDVVVDVSFTNVSSENNDYVESTQTLTFAGGAKGTQKVIVGTTDDTLLEIDETFTASLALGTGNVSNEVVVTSEGTGTIIDGDDAAVTISNASVTEGGNLSFDVTLDKDVDGNVVVDVSFTNVTSANDDYVEATQVVTFSGGTAATQSITVGTTDDTLFEIDETFTANLSLGTGNVSGEVVVTDQGTGEIIDNETANADLSVTQHGNETGPVDIIYTVTLSRVNNTGSVITFDIDDELSGSATSGSDYTAIAGTAKVSIPDGSNRGTLTVPVTNDGLLEANIETLDGTISNPSNTDVTITTPSATANITDNNEANADLSVTQHGNETGPVDIIYTVTLSKVNNTGSAITFDIDDELSGSAASGSDYTAIAGGAKISIANGTNTGTLTVTVANDGLLEANVETVDATISNPSNSDVTITTPSATANITDNNEANADLSVTQHGNETGPVDIIYTVTLSRVNNTGSAITFDIDDELSGSATSGSDYTAIAGGAKVSIANGSNTGTLTVAVVNDGLLEANEETLDATISNPSNSDVTITTPSATANITDNNEANAELSVTQRGHETGPVNVVYTVTLSKVNNTGTAITFDIDDDLSGSATSGDDYTAIAGAAIVSIANGASTGTLTVLVANDGLLEPNTETLDATISNASNNDVTITVPSATANITDNDLANADLSVTQHGNEAGPVDIIFTVTLSKANNTGSTITFDIDDELLISSTATNGDDYTSIPGNATISVADGDLTGTLTVSVSNDTELEDNIETMSAVISNSSNSDVTITTPSATANISDDDSVTASLSVVTNGDETGPVDIVFRMTLSKANDTGAIITADFSDLGTGSSTSGLDYTAVAAGAKISVAIGESTGDITIPVTDDLVIETIAETLIAEISNVSEADVTILTASATATIADNDTPPFVNPESVSESTTEDTDLTFSVANNNEVIITDVDEDLQDVTITVTNGVLTLTDVGGVTINGNGTASITVDDVSLTDINTALEDAVFSPTANYNGAATITITTLDPKTGTDTDVININVISENDPPVANDDLGNSVDEDNPITVSTIGGNDTDVDGTIDPATVLLVDPNDASNTGDSSTPLIIAGKGTYTVDGLGNVTFTPEDHFNGDASIKYTIKDNDGAVSNEATIGITINPIQDPPVAVDDSATTPEDTPVTIPVLDDDYDVDNDPLTVTSAVPDQGTVVINSDGTITLTPPVDFLGEITITYEISDGNGGTDTAIVTVTITNDRSVALTLQEVCVNDVPYVDYVIDPVGFAPTGLAQIEWVRSDNEIAQTLADQSLSGRLLWPGAETDDNGNGINWPGWDYVDGEWLQVEDGLRNGMSIRVSVNPETTISVSYPTATAECAADPNNPPEAEDTHIEVKDIHEGTLENLVSDPDSEDELTFTTSAIEEPTSGVVEINEDGSFTYTPFVGFIGDDSFVYEVCDNSTIMACTSATVTITVIEGEQEAEVLNTVISSTSPYPYDRLQIEDIENFPDNSVKVFNRWGNLVWEIEGYDNRENAFSGTGNGGGVFGSSGKLPVGTYFYVIDLGRGRAPLKGFVRIQ